VFDDAAFFPFFSFDLFFFVERESKRVRFFSSLPHENRQTLWLSTRYALSPLFFSPQRGRLFFSTIRCDQLTRKLFPFFDSRAFVAFLSFSLSLGLRILASSPLLSSFSVQRKLEIEFFSSLLVCFFFSKENSPAARRAFPFFPYTQKLETAPLFPKRFFFEYAESSDSITPLSFSR